MSRPFMTRFAEPAQPTVTVGALVFTSIAEMTERGRPTDQGINSLAQDIRATLVFCVPDENRAIAKDERAKADTLATSTLPGMATLAKSLRLVADSLEADASVCEARSKGIDPATVARQQSFSKSFFEFRFTWSEYYNAVKNGDAFDVQSGNDVADTIDSYDSQYRTFVSGYADLGFKLSTPAPAKSTAGDTLPDLGKAKDFLGSIPWGTIAIVGVIGVGGFITYKLLTRQDDSPSITVVNSGHATEGT